MADDFGKKIERFGQDVWKKTTGTVGAISKSAEIAAKTRELKDLYTEIGKQYFESHPDSARTLFPDLAGRANALKQEIADLETQVLEQKGCRKCASCGESITLEAMFCPSCGAPQSKPELGVSVSADETQGWICPACGTAMESTNFFCAVCGNKRP